MCKGYSPRPIQQTKQSHKLMSAIALGTLHPPKMGCKSIVGLSQCVFGSPIYIPEYRGAIGILSNHNSNINENDTAIV